MNSQRTGVLRIITLCLIPLLLTLGCARRDAQQALDQAQAAKDQAQAAQAPGYVPDQWSEANRLLNQAQQNFDNGEYQQAIESANTAQSRFLAALEAVPAVKQRVDQQIAEIEEGLETANANIEQARQQGGATPEEINAVADQVTALQNEYDTTYRTEVDEEELNAFIARVNDAVQQTESLASAYLRPDARQAKDDILAMIEEARQLKADVHAPEQFNQAQEKANQFDALERDGDWQAMIDLAAEIRPELNNIITLAQERAAGDILQELANQVNQAKQLGVEGVPEYDNNIQQAEQALADGRQELANQNYSVAISAANDARDALQRASQSLGDAARSFVQTAQSNLQAALDLEAERYAPSVVSQVREGIASAQSLLDEEQYLDAYQTASAAAQASEGAPEAARRGKAQLSLNRVEQPFSVLESQGGAQYSPEAYRAAQDAVQRLRGQFESGEYEAVSEGEEQALEVIRESMDILGETAAGFIGRAEEALEEARDSQAPRVVAMQYANAVNYRDAAERALADDRFLTSIQNAESAIQAAREAENRSYQLQAEQNLREAERYLNLAVQANQDTLSPLAYRNAAEAARQTSSMLSAGDYMEAFQRSGEARELAQDALNAMVIKAREQVDAALGYQAMNYSQPEIEEALTNLTRAEEAQNARNFAAANEAAARALDLSSQAQSATLEQRSAELLLELANLRGELEYNLAPVHTPALFRRAMDHLTEARVEQIDQDYEASFRHAAIARDTRDQIYAQMREDLEGLLGELGETSQWLGEEARDSAGRGIKLALMDEMGELRRTIEMGDWREAYAAAEQAAKVGDRARQRMESLNRAQLAQELNAALEPYREQNALAIVPETQTGIQSALQALSRPGADGLSFEETVEKHNAAMEMVENLPGNIVSLANQRTDEIAATLQEAQDAGARKYYQDWFRELSSDLQWLRNSIRGEDYEGISSRIEKLETEASDLLAATELAANEDSYLQALNINLGQMSDIIDGFGFLAELPAELIVAAKATEYKLDPVLTDMYSSLQGDINARSLRINAEILEERVEDMQPPETLEKLHKKAVKSFEYFRRSAQGFEFYGESEAFDLDYRERNLRQAYEYLEKTLSINEDIQFAIDSHRKRSQSEKLQWNLRRLEEKFGEFYFNWEAE